MVPLILNCAGCQVENGLEGGWWVVSVQQRQKQGGRCGGSYSHQAGDTPPPGLRWQQGWWRRDW